MCRKFDECDTRMELIYAIIGVVVGGGIAWFVASTTTKKEGESALAEAAKTKEKAEREAKELTAGARTDAERVVAEAKNEARERRAELLKREESIDRRETDVTETRKRAEKARGEAEKQQERLSEREQEFEALKAEAAIKLAQVADMTPKAAKDELLKHVEHEAAEEIEKKRKTLEEEGEATLSRRAQEILMTAIQRYAGSAASDAMTSVVTLPNEELKGRIIGKEGRNIKAFERASGCEVLVDDTPGAIVISAHDPVRREIAKRALIRLMEDGRIQPTRIEEVLEACKSEVEDIIRQAGVEVADDLGLSNIDPRLVYLIGRLKFRTSFGQNVLQHSVEMAHIASMIAFEVGANAHVAKFGALVHDIGKAVDHEVEGTHVEIGRKLLKRFGVDEEVIKAMQAHHEEYPFENPESVIVLVADKLSAARPGARRDSVENYLRRISELEGAATSFTGVERAYAIQAGREVRVFVMPDKIDDAAARKLARDIADKIQRELQYPGEIKVTLIREKRVIEYAK